MSANRRRGEISAVIDGRECTLCLTLGSLAELENAFAASDLTALAERFSSGKLSARDLMEVIAAGLRGAGLPVQASDVAAMKIEGGATGAAAIVAELLQVTFGAAEAAASPDP